MRITISYYAYEENHIPFSELGYFQCFVKYVDFQFQDMILLQKISDDSYLILNKVGNIKIAPDEDIIPVEIYQ